MPDAPTPPAEPAHAEETTMTDVYGYTYPADFNRCVMCGAEPGQPCTVISTAHDEHYDQTAGDRRPYPHAQRSKGREPEPPAGSMAVKDEPDHYADQPHTANCGGPGVCPLTVRDA